jgi:hypothetical protein
VLRQRRLGRDLHPGELFGLVLTWLWRTEPERAVGCVADLLAKTRYHADGADRTITLGDLLSGFRYALQDMSDDEAEALLDRLRSDVPAHFDADVTSTPGAG